MMNRYVYISLFVIGIIACYSVAFAQIGIECNARVKCVCESNSVRVVPCPADFSNTAIDCTKDDIPEGTCEVDCGQEVGALCEEIMPITCKKNETANCIVTLPVEVGISGSGCPIGETECAGQCVDTDSDNANCGACGNVCDVLLQCITGVCSCPGGLELCSGQCIDVSGGDPDNCGGCGIACGLGETCVSGSCQCPYTTCDGGCFDTQNDPNHCGICEIVCDTGEICQVGQCLLPPEN